MSRSVDTDKLNPKMKDYKRTTKEISAWSKEQIDITVFSYTKFIQEAPPMILMTER